MTLQDFKKRLSEIDFKTGAKRALTAVTITAALVSASVPVAHAAVDVDRIVGEPFYSEDRTKTKIEESHDIYSHFYGFDRYGNQTITLDDVRKAIELSDVLNDYYFDLVEYTNTRVSEVTELDIEKLYDQYLVAKNKGEKSLIRFCENNLYNKPAIDAFVTFSCGTVSNNIKKNVGDLVCAEAQTKSQKITASPRVVVKEEAMYVVIEVNGETQIFELAGDDIQEIIDICASLDSHYTIALDNIAGYSDKYEDHFAYNGVDYVTEESAWLSFRNDDLQDELTTAMDLCDGLVYDETHQFEIDDFYDKDSLNRREKAVLEELGFRKSEIRDAVSRDASLTKTQTKRK